MGIETCRTLYSEKLHLFFKALPVKALLILWLNQIFSSILLCPWLHSYLLSW